MNTISHLFEGRLGRTHFGYSVLAMIGIAIVLQIIVAVFTSVSDALGMLVNLVAIVALIPVMVVSLGVSARRYHDLGWSGWFVLLGLVPIVGFVMLLVQLFKPSVAGSNQYGTTLPKSVPFIDAVLNKTSASSGTPASAAEPVSAPEETHQGSESEHVSQ